jgi:hypothetical protein
VGFSPGGITSRKSTHLVLTTDSGGVQLSNWAMNRLLRPLSRMVCGRRRGATGGEGFEGICAHSSPDSAAPLVHTLPPHLCDFVEAKAL